MRGCECTAVTDQESAERREPGHLGLEMEGCSVGCAYSDAESEIKRRQRCVCGDEGGSQVQWELRRRERLPVGDRVRLNKFLEHGETALKGFGLQYYCKMTLNSYEADTKTYEPRMRTLLSSATGNVKDRISTSAHR